MEWNNQTIYTIHWDSSGEQYLYGSQVNVKQDRSVTFRNELMTTGTVLSKWFSQSDFSQYRKAPGLPYLKNGETYKIKNAYKNLASGSLFLKVTFYDFFGQVLNELILRKELNIIEVPQAYKSYTIELITAGCFQFEFYYLELLHQQYELDKTSEVFQLTGLLSEKLSNIDLKERMLNIVLWEPGANLSAEDYRLLNQKIKNVWIIGQASVNYDAYFKEENILKLQALYEKSIKQGKQLVFWGFNRWSNYLASYYQELMPKSDLNIGTNQLLMNDVLKLKQMMGHSSLVRLLDRFYAPIQSVYEPRDMLNYSSYSSQLLKERLKEM